MKEVIVKLTSDRIKIKGGEYMQDLVRCKECKWQNEYGCHNPIWGDGWANYPSPNPRADDFCSYGEREGE